MSLQLAHLPRRDDRPAMEVVLATTDADREALYRLRHRIYVEEMGIVPVDHPFVKQGSLVDPFDAWSIQLLLKVDGVPAGTVRVTRVCDGPLEIDEYVDATGTLDGPSQAAEITRLMVLQEHRGTEAAPLLLHGLWRALQRLNVRVLLFAGKVGSLGRYYKNLSPLGLRIAPETFVYGLTGCRYELIVADLGQPRGLIRLAWRLHIALLALLAFGFKGAAHGAFRRRVRRPAEPVAVRLRRPTEATASVGLSPS